MLRVCGLTLDHTFNYGSCFQAYALQKAVEDSVLSDGSGCTYQLIPIRTFKEWRTKRSVRRLLLMPLMNMYRKQFVAFENKYMHYSAAKSLADLPVLNNDTDAFVCGSDVIWNPDHNHNLNSFYLDFAKKYKFSYAASFGKVEISDHKLSDVKLCLEEFNAISVREKTGAEIVNRCVNKAVKVVSDPVFLITEDEWNSIMPPSRPEKKYIFVYLTHLSESASRFLEILKKNTGMKVIFSAWGPKQALKMKVLQVQTPEKWLQLLHDAEYVVTNSFHATAFSVMFHKKFFTIVNGEKSKGINVRMNDFLSMIGLEDRIFSDIPDKLNLSDIDYTNIDEKINSMREDSLQFLRQNLEAAYQIKEQAGI